MPTPIILLVDDDFQGRRRAAIVLRHFGFEVQEAGDGIEALRYIAPHGQIDLTVSNVFLPGLEGYKLVDMAKMHRPEMKVIYRAPTRQNALKHLGTIHGEIVDGPCSTSRLISAVRAALPWAFSRQGVAAAA